MITERVKSKSRGERGGAPKGKHCRVSYRLPARSAGARTLKVKFWARSSSRPRNLQLSPNLSAQLGLWGPRWVHNSDDHQKHPRSGEMPNCEKWRLVVRTD